MVVVVVVRVDQLAHVLLRDRPLGLHLPLADPAHAGGDVGGEEQHQIGLRHLRLEQQVELLEQHELVVGEVDVGEDAVLLEGVVGEHQPREELGLDQVALLLEALEQEVELGLERGARDVAVEILEERVGDVLEHLHAFEALGQPLDQRGLAGADRSVDGEISERELCGHLSARGFYRRGWRV